MWNYYLFLLGINRFLMCRQFWEEQYRCLLWREMLYWRFVEILASYCVTFMKSFTGHLFILWFHLWKCESIHLFLPFFFQVRAGTQPGQKVVLKGKGIWFSRFFLLFCFSSLWPKKLELEAFTFSELKHS